MASRPEVLRTRIELRRRQIEGAFDLAKKRKSTERDELIAALALSEGLLASEIAALNWSDVFDRSGRLLPRMQVRAAYGGGKVRSIPLREPRTRRLLVDYYAKRHFPHVMPGTPLLKSQRRERMGATAIARMITALLRKSGVSRGTSRLGKRMRVEELLSGPGAILANPKERRLSELLNGVEPWLDEVKL